MLLIVRNVTPSRRYQDLAMKLIARCIPAFCRNTCARLSFPFLHFVNKCGAFMDATSMNFTGAEEFLTREGNIWDTHIWDTHCPVGHAAAVHRRKQQHGRVSQPVADNYTLATDKRTNERTDKQMDIT